jgi:hypothetical protein
MILQLLSVVDRWTTCTRENAGNSELSSAE